MAAIVAACARRSGIAPQRRPFGDDPAEAGAMAGEELVQRVDEHGRPRCAQHAAERAGEPHLGEERGAAPVVARHRRPVAEDEPPALAAGLLGDGGEQAARLVVLERKQRQLLAAVERGDDPRRPAAEPSAAGVEQHRAWQPQLGHEASVCDRPPPQSTGANGGFTRMPGRAWAARSAR